MQRESLRTGLLLVGVSIVGGACLATISLMSHRAFRAPPFADLLDWIAFAVVVGGGMGLFSCAYITPFLINTPLSASLPLVFGASALPAAVVGVFNPALAAMVTFAVQLTTCAFCAYRTGPPRHAPLFACRSCRYDLRGSPSAECPECGGPNTWLEVPMAQADIPARLAGSDVPCPACGYNLRGIPEPRCPECGRVVTMRDLNQPRREFFLRRRAQEVWRVGIVMALVLAGVHLFLMLRALFDPLVRASSIPLPGVSLLALAICGAWAAVAILLARRARKVNSEPMVWAAAAAAWLGVMASLAIAKFA